MKKLTDYNRRESRDECLARLGVWIGRYSADSRNRFCIERLGSYLRTDGTWGWADGAETELFDTIDEAYAELDAVVKRDALPSELPPFFSCGDLFWDSVEGVPLLLAQVGYAMGALIELDTGNRLEDPIVFPSKSYRKVYLADVQSMCKDNHRELYFVPVDERAELLRKWYANRVPKAAAA